ncbi:hypothetical protein DLM78_18430 [Leptospira stimsonii]|uniref:Uncharacterized protein n=1 Tax=Leptospira stimsonii TaxID=2202203 RepID=A0A8B3CKN6_9LEPT|nr:hypothetical protein DLM78_18430 [Leptospira stimsonii]
MLRSFLIKINFEKRQVREPRSPKKTFGFKQRLLFLGRESAEIFENQNSYQSKFRLDKDSMSDVRQ